MYDYRLKRYILEKKLEKEKKKRKERKKKRINRNRFYKIVWMESIHRSRVHVSFSRIRKKSTSDWFHYWWDCNVTRIAESTYLRRTNAANFEYINIRVNWNVSRGEKGILGAEKIINVFTATFASDLIEDIGNGMIENENVFIENCWCLTKVNNYY